MQIAQLFSRREGAVIACGVRSSPTHSRKLEQLRVDAFLEPSGLVTNSHVMRVSPFFQTRRMVHAVQAASIETDTCTAGLDAASLPASIEPGFSHVRGTQQRFGLVLRLLPFRIGLRIGNDAAAGLNMQGAILDNCGA